MVALKESPMIAKIMGIHPVETVNVYTEFHGSLQKALWPKQWINQHWHL